MFALTALVYPVVLAALCLGAGLLVDRLSGGLVHAMLLPVVGAAALIAVSQLTTYVPSLASATPTVLVVVAAAGFVVGAGRLRELLAVLPRRLWQVALPIVAYAIALAPVLAAGRPSFSGYGDLPDSALHMIGADYLIRHGQEYANLDLRNSYGQYIHSYFATSYPSGSHTLFGGSAWILGQPLIWMLQPFCAFILATAVGPAWILARRVGLAGAAAALAALTVTLPALVYGYELVASLKEVTTLPMLLGLAVLVADHARWLRGGPVGAGVPLALLLAAGVSALGLAFGPWAAAGALVLGRLAIAEVAAGRMTPVRLGMLAAVTAGVGLVAAWPTWSDATGSLQVATAIASTSNPGNLTSPLRIEQVLGTWLAGSYRHQAAAGIGRLATYALVIVTGIAALTGAVHLLRVRAFVLAGWIAVTIALWLGLTAYGTTWADAKLLMLTSPIVLLLAWAGVAGMRASSLPLVAPILALVIGGGVLVSDAVQYRGSNLAPTARYDELASLDARYAGRGPVLFSDFDEWSVYELRDVDVGGPDFIFRPAGLENIVHAHGDPVDLDRIPPPAFLHYPLIITRRDPTASRPPSAYRLAWEGRYYQVWARLAGAPAAAAHVRLTGTRPIPCSAVAPIARVARTRGLQLVTARPVQRVAIALGGTLHPSWQTDHPERIGLLMTPNGSLTASFRIPKAGPWSLWLQGEIMPRLGITLDGRSLGSISDEVSGNAFTPDTAAPITLSLAAGPHQLVLARGRTALAPGDGGAAILHAVFLTRLGVHERLKVTPAAQWRALCGGRFDWIEAT